MGGWSPANAIAMERRHILDGEKRVARQEALVSELIKKGNHRLAGDADDLLGLFREILEASRHRLRELEGQYGGMFDR